MTGLMAATVAFAQPRFPLVATAEEAQAQTNAALGQYGPQLNAIGYALLEQRATKVSAIKTRTEAEQRQAAVRRKIKALVGGIPKSDGPVVVRTFGSVAEDGFTVERVAYQSCPDYWVTANVFVPPGKGPFPAVVITAGHGGGKANLFAWGATLARAGMIVLAYDPMGQGERVQHFDPELGDSKLERSGEHEHANQAALLVGQPIARYWFADGMRAVDYLIQRGDVDPARIGTFGCSGGGTAAAYLAAMDPRVAVAVVSSYITSFRELLPGNGPQDAEQTLPGFISSGLDFADWVELAAPRPYAVVAYEEDFFPIKGAIATFNEAQAFYGHFDAAPQVELVHGPGGHCNLTAVMPQVLGFLAKHLQGPAAPVPVFADIRPRDSDALTVTPTGQILTSLGGKTIDDYTRARAAEFAAPPVAATHEAMEAMRPRLQRDIGELTGAATDNIGAAAVRLAPLASTENYRVESVEFETEPGITLHARLATPVRPGPHPVVVWLDALPLDKVAASADFKRLADSGHVVLALQPRAVLGEPGPNPERFALGQYQSSSLRAIIMGRTLTGLRVNDVRQAIAWIKDKEGADAQRLLLYGRGALGMVALHEAVLDPLVTEVVVENTLVSYRTAVQAGLRRNLSELVIPGVLTRYDTPDLLTALSPRRVTILNPANALGQPLKLDEARAALAPALESARRLGEPDRIRVQRRDWRDPLPID